MNSRAIREEISQLETAIALDESAGAITVSAAMDRIDQLKKSLMKEQKPKFINGLFARAPHQKAPDFVKCSLSIKREELIAWLSEQEGEWVNIDVKESREGKWYASVNEWKPEKREEPMQKIEASPVPDVFDVQVDEIPFR